MPRSLMALFFCNITFIKIKVTTEKGVCCQAAPIKPTKEPAIDRRVACESYDGAAAELLTCSQCGGEFYFFMVDWSNNQRRRIFAPQSTGRKRGNSTLPIK